jgi:hypothetical protein
VQNAEVTSSDVLAGFFSPTAEPRSAPLIRRRPRETQ